MECKYEFLIPWRQDTVGYNKQLAGSEKREILFETNIRICLLQKKCRVRVYKATFRPRVTLRNVWKLQYGIPKMTRLWYVQRFGPNFALLSACMKYQNRFDAIITAANVDLSPREWTPSGSDLQGKCSFRPTYQTCSDGFSKLSLFRNRRESIL